MAASSPNLVALSLTNVYYDPSDHLAHLLAYLTLTPQLLFAVYLTLLYSTREIEIFLTFAGQLACEALNIVLKRVFKELRPEVMRELHRGYGMPSSHAQFVGYFAVYVGLFLVWRHCPSVRVEEDGSSHSGGGNQAGKVGGARKGGKTEAVESDADTDTPSHRHTRPTKSRRRKASVVINGIERPLDPTITSYVDGQDVQGAQNDAAASPIYSLQLHHPKLTHTVLTLSVIALAIVVAGSRVYLHYHTTKQVLVGFAAGSLFAVFWFGVTEVLRRTGWVEWALDLTLVRSMRVRDLVCEEDLVEIGWQIWEDKRRRRQAINQANASRHAKSR